ncbi:MAG: hypothetical protein WA783_11185, partial [Phormidesmis sp.]
ENDQMNRRAAASSMAYAKLCGELAVPYLDTYQPLSQNALWGQEVAARDGYHPAASGYLAFSQLITAWPDWQRWFVQD